MKKQIETPNSFKVGYHSKDGATFTGAPGTLSHTKFYLGRLCRELKPALIRSVFNAATSYRYV